MPETDPTVYVMAHPDGRYLYCLPVTPSSRTLVTASLANGIVLAMNHLRGDWYSAEVEVHSITLTTENRPRVTHWRLTDRTVLSERFPETLTREEFSDRSEDILYEIYESATEPVPPTVTVYEGPWPVMEGREPPQPGELPWQADLPYVLANRPEYAHLFPGKILGLRDHLYQVIKSMPTVQYCFDKHGCLEVTVQAPYDPAQSHRVRNTGRSGQPLKTFRDVVDYKRRMVILPVPAWVAGENYEAALVQWNEEVEHWTGIVRDLGVTACGHCDGTGYADTGVTNYEKRG